MVADRLGPTEGPNPQPARADLHVAIVVEDVRVLDAIRKGVFVISPPLWEGTVQLHVLHQNPRKTRQDTLYQLAVVQLGLADPSIIGLNDGLQMDMGWPSDDEG